MILLQLFLRRRWMPKKHKNSLVKDGVTFVEVARLSLPPANTSSSLPQKAADPFSSSLKCLRSPESVESCKRCLRSGHTVDECRHQLTCRRCAGAGHYVARCPLKYFIVQHTARSSLNSSLSHPAPTSKTLLHIPTLRPDPATRSIRVSLPISEAIIQSKEDLKRRVLVKVIFGNASVRSLLAVLLTFLIANQCENITPFGNDFILTLFSAKAVLATVKLNSLSLNTNLGPCTIGFAHWTPEFGSHAVAAGNYNWIRITNLPLHCWNWDSIAAVLKPIDDLIFVRKREDVSLEHMRVLVRLKSPTAFPLELIVDVGVRSFKVNLEDDGVPVIRSKVTHEQTPLLNSQKKLISLTRSVEPLHSQPTSSSCFPPPSSRQEKGKDPISLFPRSIPAFGSQGMVDRTERISRIPQGMVDRTDRQSYLPHLKLALSVRTESLNSDDHISAEVDRSSVDRSGPVPRIPLVARESNEEGEVGIVGDIPCMLSDVNNELTMAVGLPRDKLPLISPGSLPLSAAPRDQASDSLNYSSNPLSSLQSPDFIAQIKEPLHRDENNLDSFTSCSSKGVSLPRDVNSSDNSIDLLPRDEIPISPFQVDSSQPTLAQFGSSLPNRTQDDPIQFNSEHSKNLNLSSDLNLISSGSLLCSSTKESLPDDETISLEKNELPNHLKLLPPAIPIPEGYKWIFVHGDGPLFLVLILINSTHKILHHWSLHWKFPLMKNLLIGVMMRITLLMKLPMMFNFSMRRVLLLWNLTVYLWTWTLILVPLTATAY